MEYWGAATPMECVSRAVLYRTVKKVCLLRQSHHRHRETFVEDNSKWFVDDLVLAYFDLSS